jgi:molybdenum cofactor cytidylyltransferase
MSEVAAIILAAGRGTRFGSELKLLAHLDGKPLVRYVAEAVLGSSVRPVIIVIGDRATDVKAVLDDLDINFVQNPYFAGGLSTSLKAGFAALPPRAQAVVALLGDMPLVTADLIDSLVCAWKESSRPAALIPTVDGQRGNPVVLSRNLEEPIKRLSADVGASAILRERSDVVEWPIANRAILQDVDTKDQLRKLQRPNRPESLYRKL